MSETHNDRVEYLATVAGAIVRGSDAIEGSLAAQGDAEGLQVEMLAPIEDEAPKRQATTPRGALFQLLLAAGDLGELVGTENWDAEALRARHLRIEGCLHSAINVFERECALERDAIGGGYYARRSYVPEIWQAVPRDA